MKIKADYHTHTIYSRGFRKYGCHARGTIRENVEQAFVKGLSEVAITDHGPSHRFYGLNKKDLSRILMEIEELKAEYEPKGLKILFGIESNLMDYEGRTDAEEWILKHLDILIMGYHFGSAPTDFTSFSHFYLMNPLTKIFKVGCGSIARKNAKAYCRAMDRYPINIISHPGSKIPVDIEELASYAVKKHVSLEINAKHRELTLDDLRVLKGRFHQFVVGSDAHRSEDVANVARALQRAEEAGISLEDIVNIER